MKYYLDTEFDGCGGELISLALISEDDVGIYVVFGGATVSDEWVRNNVLPILWDTPNLPHVDEAEASTAKEAAEWIASFLDGDAVPVMISDWPDDIRYLCQALITGPGEMIKTARILTFQVVRVDAYPNDIPDCIQHNALWDAFALKTLLGDRP